MYRSSSINDNNPKKKRKKKLSLPTVEIAYNIETPDKMSTSYACYCLTLCDQLNQLKPLNLMSFE